MNNIADSMSSTSSASNKTRNIDWNNSNGIGKKSIPSIIVKENNCGKRNGVMIIIIITRPIPAWSTINQGKEGDGEEEE